MKKLTLALCIASIVGTSTAFANTPPNGDPNGNNGKKKHYKKSSVVLKKKVKVTKHLDYDGEVRIAGRIIANGLGMAVVENKQKAKGNTTRNYYHENDAKIKDDVFRNVTGNLGVNEAAGDNNVQANNAAIAAIDATFAFGSGDAEIFSNQKSYRNRVINYASTNRAVIRDDAFRDTSGNIGVNVAAGDNNVQANNLALATYKGNLGEASVSNYQTSKRNFTNNESVVEDRVRRIRVSLDLNATGSYEGTSTLAEPYYPEVWVDDGVHDNGDPAFLLGHIDFDGNNPSGSEYMTFAEEGDVTLSGTVSGRLPFFIQTVKQRTQNTAVLKDNAFKGASGNIGVNVASGTGNLQSNSLAMTSIQANGATTGTE